MSAIICARDFAKANPALFGVASAAIGLLTGLALSYYFPLQPTFIAPADVVPPPAPLTREEHIASAHYQVVFRRDLPGSDDTHWGEGQLYISADRLVLDGNLSWGPDMRIYLSPRYVVDEAQFRRIKAQAVQVSLVKHFVDFSYPLPQGIDVGDYAAVVVWCERVSRFITAGRIY